jgi:4-alpha-glucanotransferase
VLQFAFGEDMGTNPYILHNHVKNSVAFTGTHDNNTTVGWYKAAGRAERKRVSEYIGIKVTVNNVHQILHRHVLMSVSQLAVVPIQDLLGLDESAIMNRPGTSEGNWDWQLTQNQIPIERAAELKKTNIRYGRWEETEKIAETKKTKPK